MKLAKQLKDYREGRATLPGYDDMVSAASRIAELEQALAALATSYHRMAQDYHGKPQHPVLLTEFDHAMDVLMKEPA